MSAEAPALVRTILCARDTDLEVAWRAAFADVADVVVVRQNILGCEADQGRPGRRPDGYIA